MPWLAYTGRGTLESPVPGAPLPLSSPEKIESAQSRSLSVARANITLIFSESDMLARNARRCVTLTLNEYIRGLGPARRTLAHIRIVMAWSRPCLVPVRGSRVPACRQPAGALHGNVVRQSGQVAGLRMEAAEVAVLARVLLLLHPQEEHEGTHAHDHARAAHLQVRPRLGSSSGRVSSELRPTSRTCRLGLGVG